MNLAVLNESAKYVCQRPIRAVIAAAIAACLIVTVDAIAVTGSAAAAEGKRAAAQAAARRSVINLQRVRGKARTRARSRCYSLDAVNPLIECIPASVEATGCRRQGLYRPDVGWCHAAFMYLDHYNGRYYECESLTWGRAYRSGTDIRWRLGGWSCWWLGIRG